MSRYLKKPKHKSRPITVLYDDRERKPWSLPWSMKRKRLAAGDYTIEGYAEVMAVEKKSGLVELLGNLSGADRIRFEKALLKLSKLPYKVMVIEDNYTNWPYALKAIEKKSGGRVVVNKTSLDCWLAKITMQYGIPVLFAGSPADEGLLVWLFKTAHEHVEGGAR